MSDEKRKKGFAVMSRAKVRKIASLGGKAIAPEARSFSQDRELARKAGKAGGMRTQENRRNQEAP